ncbi:unnamed protein product [Timema podura]|uniref:Secreted protein n=1 Tax=Timema podura TaxID=61482 RepID=A0ABN7NUB6_TIMPD|nr:unnamed protein product [Timema podura]
MLKEIMGKIRPVSAHQTAWATVLFAVLDSTRLDMHVLAKTISPVTLEVTPPVTVEAEPQRSFFLTRSGHWRTYISKSEFLLCRREMDDPRKCINEGKDVTSCSLDFFRKIKKSCFDEFTQHADCLNRSSGHFAYDNSFVAPKVETVCPAVAAAAACVMSGNQLMGVRQCASATWQQPLHAPVPFQDQLITIQGHTTLIVQKIKELN